MTDDLDEQSQEARGNSRGGAGGASISMRDPRVSRLANWALGVLGVSVVAVGAWVGSSINELTVAVARASDRMEYLARSQVASEAKDERQDAQINQLQRDVAIVEGKVFRGIDGYQEPVRPRGR